MDDCLVFYKKKKVLLDLIESLKDNFNLTDEGDLASFLGIQFKRLDNSNLELSQPHLIQRIIEALSLTKECKKHDILSNTILHKDVDGQ